MNKKITIIVTYYNQSKFLPVIVSNWIKWKDEIKDQFSFYIIDDCSEISAKDVLSNINLSNLDISIYRVKENIAWNQPGAFNLGMQQCQTDYAMIIDMDTMVTEELAIELLKLAEQGIENVAYRFNRNWSGNLDRPARIHPKACLLSKKDFWEVGGYDEDLCGYYGHDDSWFWICWNYYQKKQVDMKNLYLQSEIEQGRSPNMQRVPGRNAAVISKKQQMLKSNTAKINISKNHIRFEWEQLL
tara:strand:- start:86 stop:814 length:729 start_codon:yes stop_codon:yes gene_type:complete